jgi:hypothetical protein
VLLLLLLLPLLPLLVRTHMGRGAHGTTQSFHLIGQPGVIWGPFGSSAAVRGGGGAVLTMR